ncbi:methylated-DNA--[protein]-cysteine S-methyltransferase [Helicobacter pylori]|uniref:methylated-DNA--[protein]-cysteine S-methyltransferase n=1 Tax=Helicobacter pylori TaxID=210 RepID=UPI0002B928E2|nr:methylated-DNA--[protein]-cysteine S-methyltransferase [Helicobacter pylori]EMH24850.1 6-O-methylguanine DNA methyltransferase, DNA binding domain protein [Helicobacter pylori GAM263BFi]
MILYHYYFKTPKSFPLEYLHLCANESHLLRLDFDIAKLINNPKSCRAIGNANRNNPISLIVPCHRVVRKNGALGGYNGGIEVKKWLLEFESKILNERAKNFLIS